jgi:hypothetical protein
MQRKILMIAAIMLILFSMLACYSTACMSDDELVNWLDTGTAQPCFSK